MLLSPCCKTVSQMFRLGEHTASECCKHYKLEPNHVVVCFHHWLESVHWILGSQHVCKDESESAISNLDVILSKLRNLLFKKRTWMLCEESCHLLTTFDFRMWSTSIPFQICWQGLGGKGGFSKDWFFGASHIAIDDESWMQKKTLTRCRLPETDFMAVSQSMVQPTCSVVSIVSPCQLEAMWSCWARPVSIKTLWWKPQVPGSACWNGLTFPSLKFDWCQGPRPCFASPFYSRQLLHLLGMSHPEFHEVESKASVLHRYKDFAKCCDTQLGKVKKW